MTGDHAPWFDHTIMLVSDTFRKNPRQEKTKFNFFSSGHFQNGQACWLGARAGHENNLGVQRPKITQAPQIRLEGLLIQAKTFSQANANGKTPPGSATACTSETNPPAGSGMT
jgi:hypothetical protein